jgi:hypothetical protein
VSIAPVHDLRRIADAVAHLRDRGVQDVVLRSDCRQLKVQLDSGEMLLITVMLDEQGKPRLDADLLRAPDGHVTGQLEVEFEQGA